MSTNSISIDAEDYFGDFYNLDTFLDAGDGYEDTLKWTDSISNGFFYFIKLRPGLMIAVLDHKALKTLFVPFDSSTTCFLLSYHLSGNISIDIESSCLVEGRCFNCDSGVGYFSYTPDRYGTGCYPKGSSVRSIAVLIEPWLLNDFLFENDLHNSVVSDIFENGRQEKFLHHTLNVSPLINIRLHEIFAGFSQGRLRKMLLEGKVLELIALSLSQLTEPNAFCRYSFEDFSQPPGFVHDARDILINNMQTPYSLSELSKKVGVNKKKLCCCFRQAYGTSVFDYLRTIRLEKSKELLESSGKTVTEVALKVGYAQQSNFTKEFTKYFGVSPRTFLH